MQFIQGTNRQQVTMQSLDDYISNDNPVRFIDAFVDKLDLQQLQFQVAVLNKEGRPAYASKLFLKIYLYGYLNGIRSSRKFEKECSRNIELQWLTNNLQPNYHTIADFRKNNPTALRNVFKLFVLFLKDINLVSCNLIAIDGTKVRANNSKKNNYSPKKIERHLHYIEQKTNEYLQQIDATDANDESIKISTIAEKLERLKTHKIKYELLQKQMDESGEPQVSTTDADARALLVQGQVVEVAHNMQAAVDAENKLIVATHTINRNDRNALSAITLEAKANIQVDTFTSIVDKGYHNGGELQRCKDAGITTIVAAPEIVNSNEKGTTKEYMVTQFIYNKTDDTYTCPDGKTLTTKGTWHEKKNEKKQVLYRFKKYRTTACKDCPVKNLCTAKADGRREIDRSEYADAVEENNLRYKENQILYKQRQMINEHIFGTIKRQWGYNYTNLRGLLKVSGEHSLICLVYNIKRTINILGIEKLLEAIKKWQPNYKGIVFLFSKQHHFKPFYGIYYFEQHLAA
jgi:transposase